MTDTQPFIINHTQANIEEWGQMKNSFPDIQGEPSPFVDHELTRQELEVLLDSNHDGRLFFDDFLTWKPSHFDQISQILSRHGFNLPGKLIQTQESWADYEKQRDSPLWSSEEFALETIRASHGHGPFWPAWELKSNPEFMLKVLACAGGNLSYASWELLADPEFMMRALHVQGYLQYGRSPLSYAVLELKYDRDFMLKAVNYDGRFLEYAAPQLKADREIVLAAVRNDSRAMNMAAPELRADWNFIEEAVRNNICLLDSNFRVSGTLRYRLRQRLQDGHDWATVLPDSDITSYVDWRQAIKKQYNIEFLHRFHSSEELFKTLSNRLQMADLADKPVALLVYPKKDSSGAFQKNAIKSVTLLGHQVLYYEAGNEEELILALRAGTQDQKKKADIIVLAGHGTRTTLALGGDDLRIFATMNYDETLYLDTSDFDKPPDIPLQDFIRPEGEIILESCSTGENGALDSHNLANRIAAHLPTSVTLHASKVPSNLDAIRRDDHGKLQVIWEDDRPYSTTGQAIEF